jgi:hypothetical protein
VLKKPRIDFFESGVQAKINVKITNKLVEIKQNQTAKSSSLMRTKKATLLNTLMKDPF